ncbi:type II secretion system protein [Candidatus Roizmanbacteria bacterium]|nr:type II secretion system protein [Candidatus Roizmanbacteria bacterium]
MGKTVKNSFSLIEVLVFITILSLVFITATAVTIFSLRALTISQHKILATHYAEEALEWVKSEKDKDWLNFTQYASDAGITYCIISFDWFTEGACDDSYFLGTPNIFLREVKLTNIGINPVSQTDVEVVVHWQEINDTYNVTLKTSLKILE